MKQASALRLRKLTVLNQNNSKTVDTNMEKSNQTVLINKLIRALVSISVLTQFLNALSHLYLIITPNNENKGQAHGRPT